MPHCTKCGRERAPEDKFCGSCGASFTPAAPVASPAPAVASAPSVAPIPPPRPGPDRRKFARNAGIVGLIGFVLPWVSCNGGAGLKQTMSGMDLANGSGGGLFWLVPLGLGLAVLFALLAQPATAPERGSRGKLTMAGGIVALVVMVAEYLRITNQMSGDGMFGASVGGLFTIEFGAYISIAGCLGVILGGWQQVLGAKRDGG